MCTCVMRTSKIYSLSNVQICNTVLLAVVTMPYVIAHDLSMTEGLYLLTPLYSFCPPPPPTCGNHKSVLCVYELGLCLVLFLNSTYKREKIYIYVTLHFLYPFIYPWTLRLFSYLRYCKQCCNELGGAYI